MNEVVKHNILRENIQSFYLSEDVSHSTAGMKETITRNKVKQQERYLNATIAEFYNDFAQEKGQIMFKLYLLNLLLCKYQKTKINKILILN